MFGKKNPEDGFKTKILGDLVSHMIGIHGNKSPTIVVHKEANAVLPNPDGSEKHEPVGKIEAEGVMPGKSHHMDLQHGAEPEEDESSLGDLFGRKAKGRSEYF